MCFIRRIERFGKKWQREKNIKNNSVIVVVAAAAGVLAESEKETRFVENKIEWNLIGFNLFKSRGEILDIGFGLVQMALDLVGLAREPIE